MTTLPGRHAAPASPATSGQLSAGLFEAKLDASLRRATADQEELAADLPTDLFAEPASARPRELPRQMRHHLARFPELSTVNLFDPAGMLRQSTRPGAAPGRKRGGLNRPARPV